MKLFGSPSQPSSKSSRQQRLEVAKAAKENDRSRRRAFTFMKYGSDRRSVNSMNKSREHARQLAELSKNEPPAETPTAQQPLTLFESAPAPAPASNRHPQTTMSDFSATQPEDHFDPFNNSNFTNNHYSASTQPAPSLASRKATQEARSTSILDQHLDASNNDQVFANQMGSVHDSYETASVGSAYDMDFVSSRQTPPLPTSSKKKKKKKKPTLEQFVERQSPHHKATHQPQRHQGGSLVVGQNAQSRNSWPAPQERSVISMPTIPSNSTMQAHNARQTSSISGSSGAAARRRMRNQMRFSSTSSVSSQNSEVSSYSSSTPPESPASVKRLLDSSLGSAGSSTNRRSNRLVHYQQGGGSTAGGSSFYSQGSSVASHHSSDNLFDSTNDGGFTFDAFGLDESQVEREVNEAMQELAGQVPGFSVFWDQSARSPNSSFNQQQQPPLTPQDEFAPQNWDSPAGSRHSTPPRAFDDGDGFVDGFRVTRTASAMKESPQSDRSSSNSNASNDPFTQQAQDARVNLFQESAGFGTPSKWPRTAINKAPQAQSKQAGHNTPPRWESSRKTSLSAPNGQEITSSNKRGSENIMPQLQDEPDPWKEDPWGSCSENGFQSDFGNNSDQLDGVQSDSELVQPHKSAKLQKSQSDVGVPSSRGQNKSVSFHENVRIPNQQSDSAAMSQIHDDRAGGFNGAYPSNFQSSAVTNTAQTKYGQTTNTAAYSDSDYQSDYGQSQSDYNSVSDYGPSESNYASSEYGASDFADSDYGPSNHAGSDYGAVGRNASDYAQSDVEEPEYGAPYHGATASEYGRPPSEQKSYNPSTSNYRARQSYNSKYASNSEQTSSSHYGSYDSKFGNESAGVAGFGDYNSNYVTAQSMDVAAETDHVQTSDQINFSEYDPSRPGKSMSSDYATGSDQRAESGYGPMNSDDIAASSDYGPPKSGGYRARSYREAHSTYGTSNAQDEDGNGYDYSGQHSDSGLPSRFEQVKSNYRDPRSSAASSNRPAWLAKSAAGSSNRDQNSSYVPKTAVSVRSKYSRQNSVDSSEHEEPNASYEQYYDSDYGPHSGQGASHNFDTGNVPYGSRSDVGVTSGIPGESQLNSAGSADRTEEKKDDDSPSEFEKVGSLKEKWKKWESKKAFKPGVPQKKIQPKQYGKQSELGSVDPDSVSKIRDSLGQEMLTPEVVEARRIEGRRNRAEELRSEAVESNIVPTSRPLQEQLRRPATESTAHLNEKRLSECNTQRSSFASVRERLRSTQNAVDTTSKSESGAMVKSPVANQVLDRFRDSPRNGATGVSAYRDSQSDVGGSSSFLAGVKLRKTPSARRLTEEVEDEPNNIQQGQGAVEPEYNDYGSHKAHNDRPMSYRERRALGQQVQNEGIQQESPATEQDQERKPEPKKLTYRERRELELRKQQEEKARTEEATKSKEPPKRDVASLIRRRIAANKKKEAAAQSANGSNGQPQQVTQLRGMLKPVKMESPVHETATQKWSSSPQQSASPGRQLKNDFEHVDQIQHAASEESAPHKFSFSPRQSQMRSTENAATRASQDQVDKADSWQASVDDNLHQVVSPSSASGTDMEYSTDNSHSFEGKYGATKHLQQSDAGVQDHDRHMPAAAQASDNRDSVKADSRRFHNFIEARKEETTATSPNVPGEGNAQQQPNESKSMKEEEVVDVRNMLTSFLGGKKPPFASSAPTSAEDDADTLMRAKIQKDRKDVEPEQEATEVSRPSEEVVESAVPAPTSAASGGRPALKDDPKYERYFRMLKVGMPMDVVKHAMQKDGNDPSVMDGDPNKPVGLPLKEDPKYKKYFKMLQFGVSMDQVKHAMEQDGLIPEVMDQDHNLPANTCELRTRNQPKEKQTHRRARLHWKTLQKIRSNSLWAKLEKDPELEQIDIDEEEFLELFQADLAPVLSPKGLGANRKRGAAVRVIDAKRANNGGIILARLKMTHDDMADAVDRIDGNLLSPEQIENIIEYLPTKEERKALEGYMLEGGQDAAEKFDGLCECEKFMVSMMTVKHAKRKVRALLFKLQFLSCLESIAEETTSVETACDELSNSTRLRRLLGIVLQFGNRLNTAGSQRKQKAGAFTLDSLLKLNQAKAFDKKTTFLHYVVMIVRKNNEGLLSFQDDLPTVLKADKVYWDQCLADLEEVENQLENVRRISLHQARMQQEFGLKRRNPREEDDDSLGDVSLTLEEEVEALRATQIGLFTLSAIKQVSALRDKVETTKGKFNRLLEYFGEEDKKMQPHELFNIMSSFCRDFAKAKEQVYRNLEKKMLEERKKANKKKHRGKPPSGADRHPKPLKLSSLQPNMSRVIKDMRQPSTESEAVSPRRRSDGQILRRTNGAVSPRRRPDGKVSPRSRPPGPISPSAGGSHHNYEQRETPENQLPRRMHEPGSRLEPIAGSPDSAAFPSEDQFSPSSAASRESSKASLREKARARRHRHLQGVNGRQTPVTSNASMKSPRANHSPQNASSVSHFASPDRIDGNGRPAAIDTGVEYTSPQPSPSPRAAIRHRRRMEARKRNSPSSNSPDNAVDWPADVLAS